MVKKYILIGVPIIAIAAVYYFFFYNTDERVIKRRLNYIADNFSKEANENKVLTLKRVTAIKTVLKPSIHVEIEKRSISGNYSAREITRRTAGVRTHFKRLTLKFYDVNIDVSPSGTALATATARITGAKKNGETFAETRELEFGWQKVEGDWLIAAVKAVQVLEM